MGTNLGSVWAVVLMYGEEDVTVACIESLLKQDYPSLTVLLVDNDHPNGAGQRVRALFRNIHYLNTGANLGYTGGNNRGIAYALAHGAEYLFLFNNDATAASDCISLLVHSAQQARDVGMVAPKILFHDEPSRVWYAGGDFSVTKAVGLHRRLLQADMPDEAPRLDEISFVNGCAFLMPAHVAKRLSGFAEDYFMYCEDTELSVRAGRAGYRLYYQPAARVYHQDEIVTHPSPRHIRLRDRNRRRLVRTHYGPLDRLRFAVWFYPTRALRYAQYLLRGDFRRARSIVAGIRER